MSTKKTSEMTAENMMELAHAGDEASLRRLEELITIEQDEETRDMLEIAHEECEYFYYSPMNDQEQEDFDLAQMIYRRENKLFDLEWRRDYFECRMEKSALDGKVHDSVISKANDEMKKAWEYRCMGGVMGWDEKNLAEAEDDIAYEIAWLKSAREMVKTKKFLDASASFWEHIHDEREAYQEDDDECCCCRESKCPSFECYNFNRGII